MTDTKIDKNKIKYAIAVVLYSGIGAYYGQPLIHDNTSAINIIVTVFSVLAGFLVAVITLIGDPASLPSGSWRRAELGSRVLYTRLTRHKLLFLLYLSTLFLIFISVLVKGKYPMLEIWIERIFMFFAISAFALSFQLPQALMNLHKERIENEIESRRHNDK
nr:hypothetical protein [uncultured Desulfobacter sp.]